MNTIFMSSENSKTSDPHRHSLNLGDRIDWRRKDKHIALSNLSIHYSWKNIKKPYKNNEFQISAPTCYGELQLPDGSYSISDIQDCFEYIFKKHGGRTVNPSIKIYINKIEKRITFKIKTGYYFETMKLLERTKSKITRKGNGENVPRLEVTEVALMHCKVVNNS